MAQIVSGKRPIGARGCVKRDRFCASASAGGGLEARDRPKDALEFGEAAANPYRRGHAIEHHFGRLVAVAGDADDHRLIRLDDAAAYECSSTASVVPPAGSVKMPSVRARS